MSLAYDIIFVLILISYLFCLVGKVFYWIYLWQLKEYRWDRMMNFLSTRSGRKAIWGFSNILELFLIILLCATAIFEKVPEIFWILTFYFLLLFLKDIQIIRKRIFPIWTMKAIILSLLTVILLLLTSQFLFIFAEEKILAGGIILFSFLLFLVPLEVTLIIFILQPLVIWQKNRLITQARAKILKINPIVIGITGSYGKSSTKHFLQTILEQKFSSLCTPKNINSDIGIAQTILKSLSPAQQIFIVEMGAYRQGEIAKICNLVSPIIGVVTGVSAQHLSLFGDLAAIQKTKAELVKALPKSGLAVLNHDDSSCVQMAQITIAEKKFFSVANIAHVFADQISVAPYQLQFQLHLREQQALVTAPLAGAQFISAILAAVTVADHLGLNLAEIVQGIKKLTAIKGTMFLSHTSSGATVIDDHYSANPDGFLAALDYLHLFTDKRKIVITRGMDELGKESVNQHRLIGTATGKIADLVIITKKDFSKSLKDGLKQGGLSEEAIVIQENPKKIIKQFLSTLSADDVVLLENRSPQILIKYLLA
ncbi:MAG: hypothetical protein A2458_02660 [Candidatus Kerfeldbacteria bacterium RIFOXYC2_FULL_38_9]|nr:MAG: hypothetical protein A2458_02660 [Candidatus Kerfeldbacteria bacterium RIFOXYC2_FULL_38_9]